jgi:hypothetical protein
MSDRPLGDLGESERKLLAVFVRYGRDGRAITLQSLAAHSGMPMNARELATALRNLSARGLIKRGGGDPLPGSPVAFRLSRPLPGRERSSDAIEDMFNAQRTASEAAASQAQRRQA